jgi:hypothetical protein
MKVFFLAFGFLLSANCAFAVKEEVLFTCEGKKNNAGYTNTFTVMSTQSGKWKTIFSLQGYARAEAPAQPLEITNTEASDTGCVLSVEQTVEGKDADTKLPMKLVYEGQDLTLKGKQGSAFANASCKILSKSVRKQLNDCEVKNKPEVSQGILCRSEKVDDTENHIRIDTNPDFTYAERTIYQVFKDKTTELGTRSINIITRVAEGGDQCNVEISEIHPTTNQKMRLTMKLKKPFGSGEIKGRVEESKIVYKDENLTMPDHFKNMKCELSRDFYEKIKSCDIDTTVQGTNDERLRGYRVESPAASSQKSSKQNKGQN